MGSECLVVDHISKKINNSDILTDISFNVSKGEIVGLLGSNGAGKTTILKLVTGLLKPNEGQIFCCGYNMKTEYEKALASMGVVLSDQMLVGDLTGYDNLKLMGRVFGKSKKQDIDEISHLFQVHDYLKKKCNQYSLGMKQRLCLTMACISEPALLILDEPMNGLDPEGLKQLSEELHHMAKEKDMAILISSHLLSDIENLCDRVVFISHGKALGEETISQLHESGKTLSEAYFEIMGENKNADTVS